MLPRPLTPHMPHPCSYAGARRVDRRREQGRHRWGGSRGARNSAGRAGGDGGQYV